ncbi:MAG: glycosyltransferase family 4 protein [Methylobacter sp.]|jgi:Fuc2NAc and GlcNAc transferase|uniref:MraY family glycosyltransferase n=1 Tax=Methylobacter sp. TaxID=2051955 RepID=UPI0025E0DBDB|nr:glycosyltransferase family 4 protein [Methylobacter sp.]MCK9621479.1 glycosyltransferase family 4 protein [Methylobacter sp.]
MLKSHFMITLCLFSFAASYFLTGLIRRYALKNSLLDVPNARSSHVVATPRGGGLAVVIVFLLIIGGASLVGSLVINQTYIMGLVLSGALVAGVGFWDDRQSIQARWRFMVHFGAAAWGLYWLGGLPPIIFFGYIVNLGWAGQVIGLLYLVWLLNLYNFMDGIDGLAGIEAITVCCSGALMAWLVAPDSSAWVPPILLATAVLGFLVWNFPPARIFMGDAGSGFLGIVLALFSVQSAWVEPRLLWVWLILLGVFIVDATVTLCRRVLRGERFYEAHCSHAYQYASRIFGAHRPVTLAICAINIFWLLPVASLVALENLDGMLGLVVAYLPLLLLVYHYKAGDQQAQAGLDK